MLYGTLQEHIIDGKTLTGIKVSIPNPPKTAILRFPTNEEIVDLIKPEKNDTKTEQKTQDLFGKLRLDDGPEFDEYEMERAVGEITKCNGSGYERIGNSYQVSVVTPFNTTVHTLSIPTQKQITMFRRSARKNYVAAAMSLYDEIVTEISGYAEGITAKTVPPYHKLEGVSQAFAALESLDPILADPNS